MAVAITTLVVLIFINAFFAASELAFVHINENKVRIKADEGDKKAKKLYKLISQPSRFLSTIQIGITLAGFLSSAFAADFFAGPLAQFIYDLGVPISLGVLNTIAVVVITIILSYFTLVFGELVPKQLALQKPEEISNIAVGPISFLAFVCSPIVKFLTFSINTVLRLFRVDPNAEEEEATEEDIRMMIDLGDERGTIKAEERQMIENVFEFNDKIVTDISTHRTDMAAFNIHLGLDEVIEEINKYRFTRFPVYEDDLDNIVGILHVKDLLLYIQSDRSETFHLKEVIREPYFVLESQPIDVLFSNMKQNNIHIAIVLDEYGGTEGLVTIEDVIEEIVGEISSESIEPGHLEEKMEQISSNQYRLEGTLRLWELEDLLNIDFPSEEFDTISGFLIHELGYIPSKGEKPVITYKNLHFEVEKVLENRIEQIVLTVDPEKEEEQAED